MSHLKVIDRRSSAGEIKNKMLWMVSFISY